jgi:hypothetical protein
MRQEPEEAVVRQDDIRREVLPIPDRKPVSLTTYDVKDPDTSQPTMGSTSLVEFAAL